MLLDYVHEIHIRNDDSERKPSIGHGHVREKGHVKLEEDEDGRAPDRYFWTLLFSDVLSLVKRCGSDETHVWVLPLGVVATTIFSAGSRSPSGREPPGLVFREQRDACGSPWLLRLRKTDTILLPVDITMFDVVRLRRARSEKNNDDSENDDDVVLVPFRNRDEFREDTNC